MGYSVRKIENHWTSGWVAYKERTVWMKSYYKIQKLVIISANSSLIFLHGSRWLITEQSKTTGKAEPLYLTLLLNTNLKHSISIRVG